VRSEHIVVDGIRIHCLDTAADGLPLVMMHGLTANAHFFDGLAQALAPEIRLISPDLRGRGLSDKPDSGYTLEDHAGDVIGLLNHFGIEGADIGGHSYGGLLTYHIARHHPDRVRRCVVLDTPIEVDESILAQIKPSLDRLGKPVPSWDDYLASVKSQPFFHDWWDPQIEDYYRADVMTNPDGTVQSRSHPDHIRQAAEGTIGPNWRDYLEEIETPVLVVRATQGFGPPGAPPILGAEEAREAVALLGHATLAEIDGHHYSFLFGEAVVQTAAEIKRFLEG
jgi:pimeloyl-ACP methyl ester carboxylesterase